jgi:hypothetical protein
MWRVRLEGCRRWGVGAWSRDNDGLSDGCGGCKSEEKAKEAEGLAEVGECVDGCWNVGVGGCGSWIINRLYDIV